MSDWYSSFITAMITDIANTDTISLSDFRGCSHKDLHQLMQTQNVQRLPQVYQQFMLQMGRGFSSRHDDMQWTFPELLQFDKATDDKIVDDVFIIMWHQTHTFVYYGFSTDNTIDNPKVLAWDEAFNDATMTVTPTTLSEFLVSFFSPE